MGKKKTGSEPGFVPTSELDQNARRQPQTYDVCHAPRTASVGDQLTPLSSPDVAPPAERTSMVGKPAQPVW